MITKKTLTILILMTFFSGCKGKTLKNKEMEKISETDQNIEYIIPKDLKKDSILIIENYTSLNKWIGNYDDSSDDVDPIMKDKDILMAAKVKKSLLQDRSFNFVNDTVFNERIKYIFGFDLDLKSKLLYNTSNYTIYSKQVGFEDCDYVTMIPDGFLDFQRHNFYFFKNYRFFMTNAPLLVGMDELLENGKTIRFIVHDSEFHENNYVLNDSKSSLTWLINNDLNFLEILVREFGYDKEPKINKAVLNKIFKEYEEQKQDRNVSKNLFFRKDCNGNLQIREGLMQFIVSESTTKSPGTLKMLEDYGYDLGNAAHSQEPFIDLSPNEKDKLAAYIFYYVHKAYEKNDVGPGYREWKPASVLYNTTVSNPELIQRFKDNHYYNLPGFDEMIRGVELQIND